MGLVQERYGFRHGVRSRLVARVAEVSSDLREILVGDVP